MKNGTAKQDATMRYYAFISYKREDEKWAKRLQRRIEQYSIPPSVRKQYKLPKHIKPIFRDTTDLLPGQLKKNLQNELLASQHLIVVCSKRSARSEWVGEEVRHFVELGREDQILPFIIDGVPYSSNPDEECFHPALRSLTHELVGANINEISSDTKSIKREKAIVKVIARLLDLNFDDLWQRQKRRLRRLVFLWSLFAVCLFAGVSFVICRNLPFAAKITLEDMSKFNAKLPGLQRASVKLYLDNDTIEKDIDSTATCALFQNIPSKYRNQKVHVVVESWPYETLDTNLCLDNSLSLPIRRSDYYHCFGGVVRSGNDVLEGVRVVVGDNVGYTDSAGHFSVNIPEDKLAVTQPVKLYKKGYCSDLDSGEHSFYPNKNLEFMMYKKQ